MTNWNLLERDHYYRGITIAYFLKGKPHCQMGSLPRLFALLSLQTSENFVVFAKIDLVIMVQKISHIEKLKSGKSFPYIIPIPCASIFWTIFCILTYFLFIFGAMGPWSLHVRFSLTETLALLSEVILVN